MKLLRLFAAMAVALGVALPDGFAVAQQGPAKVPRIAYLLDRNAPTSLAQFQGLAQGLAALGYVDPNNADTFARQLNTWTSSRDANIEIDFFLAATADDLLTMATKAAASGADILMTVGTPSTEALRTASSAKPILAYTDLLGSGFVQTLAHPGTNVTGISTAAPDLAAKKIAILKEAAPTVRRIALLNIPSNAAVSRDVGAATEAAKALDLETVIVDFSQESDFITQFAGVAAAGVDAAYIPVATYFTSNAERLCKLMSDRRIASASSTAISCSLIGYGPNPTATYRRFATYIDALLKGAKAADLPVEQPTILDLVINRTTARLIGVSVPASILVQATQVIE